LNECAASGGFDAMSLGHEFLFVDFFRIAEVKPAPARCVQIADAIEIDAIAVSAQAVQRTMGRVCHQR
jgi:hypothetical protein